MYIVYSILSFYRASELTQENLDYGTYTEFSVIAYTL
jgi:hypothetical protein